MIDEEGTSTNPQSGIHSAEEDHNDEESEALNKEEQNPARSAIGWQLPCGQLLRENDRASYTARREWP